VALLLLKGANATLVNSAGLTARQEARGDARMVYQLFEEGNFICLALGKLKNGLQQRKDDSEFVVRYPW
jgi:hypothetical protein